MTEHRDHAIVVGASIGGLLAARVLSETHAAVTVVERDLLDEGVAPRRGVPQGRHVHGLLARGREVLEELFPGLTDELVGLGVPRADLQSEFRWVNGGRLLKQAPSDLIGLGVSRPLLESRIRARVRALPNVTVVDGCDATGLTSSRNGARVTGLRVLRRESGSAEEVLGGDLVVDATGRAPAGPGGSRSWGIRNQQSSRCPSASRTPRGRTGATTTARRASSSRPRCPCRAAER